MTLRLSLFGDPFLDGIILFSIAAIIFLVYIAFFAEVPTSNLELILDSLSCDELKEWLKYNYDSRVAQRIYVEGCL